MPQAHNTTNTILPSPRSTIPLQTITILFRPWIPPNLYLILAVQNHPSRSTTPVGAERSRSCRATSAGVGSKQSAASFTQLVALTV